MAEGQDAGEGQDLAAIQQVLAQQGAPMTGENVARAIQMMQQPEYRAQPVAVPVAPGTPAQKPASAAQRPSSGRTAAPSPQASPVSMGAAAPTLPTVTNATGPDGAGGSDTDYSWLLSALGLPMMAAPGMRPTPNISLSMPGANPNQSAIPGPNDVKQLSGPNANQFIEGSTPKGSGGPPGAPKQITKDPGVQSVQPEYTATTPKANVGEMSIEGLNQRTPMVPPTGTPNAANDAAIALAANLKQRGIDVATLPASAQAMINNPAFLARLNSDPNLIEQLVRMLRPGNIRVPARSMKIP